MLKSGEKLRISVPFIDAVTEHHLWTEQYEEQAKDLFYLLDTITQKIILELQVKLTLGEQARRWARGTDNSNAWSLVSKGINLRWRLTIENNIKAKALYEQALAVDPDYAVAMVWLAITHMLDRAEKVKSSDSPCIKTCSRSPKKPPATPSKPRNFWDSFGRQISYCLNC